MNKSGERVTKLFGSKNSSTRSKVLEILAVNPALSYSIIGDEIGVTRERVRQIAHQNGYPPRYGILKHKKICPMCGKTFYTINYYCSSTCGHRVIRKRIVVNCHQCGGAIERTPGNMRSKNGRYFCNRECLGRWRKRKVFLQE